MRVSAVFIFLLVLAVPIRAQGDIDLDWSALMTGGTTDALAGGGGSIEEVVQDMTETVGLFTYYTDEAARRALMLVNSDQLDETFFLSMTLSRGTGQGLFAAPMMWGDIAFKLNRNGDNIEVIEPNYQFSTVMGEPMALAVEAGFSDTILGSLAIEAESEEDGKVVIDLSLLLGLANPIAYLGAYYGDTMIDWTGTYVENIQGFPMNDEIDVRVLVGGYELGMQEVGLHFSISAPPGDGYMPRLVDDRVGHFLDQSMVYSAETDRTETRFVRYVQRWRLEKADPEAEVSPPVEPIVFWLENTIPLEYRDAVREGVLMWNDAFERIGIRRAIRVRQMPDDADWDPADIRYNTIRWFIAPGQNYAIGPCRTDPRTGEIYDADVGVNADMMRSIFLNYDFEVDPIRQVFEAFMPPGGPNLRHRQVPWDENTEALIERQLMSIAGRGAQDHFAAIHAFEGARTAAVLHARGMEPGSEEEDKFIHEYIVSLIGHEVGHVLGLKHNFAGSAATPHHKLHQGFWTRRHGLSQSIMDYTGSNVAPSGELQGEYFQTSLGDYDRWAIEYAYAPIEAETPEEELEALNEVASRAPEAQLRYATDEDMYGWALAMDPDAVAWNLGDDLVRYHLERLDVANELIDRILEHWSDPGTRPPTIRRAFFYAFFDYYLAAMNVPRLIGGVRGYRDHVGDPGAHLALVPVSAAEQRRALQFLDEFIWSSDQYQFDADLINMLGMEHLPGLDRSLTYYAQKDFDLHAYVLDLQSWTFTWIYDPIVLQRVVNNEVRMPEGEEIFTMVELFDTVRGAIWTEVTEGAPIDSYRRNLQRSHLEMVAGIVLDPAYGTPEDAITLARRDLVILKDSITSLLSGEHNLDTITVAHLEECLSRINLTLIAPMDRGGDEQPFFLFY